MTAEDLIAWTRAVDRHMKAVQAEKARMEDVFRRTLRQAIHDNEVDRYIRRRFAAWYFVGHPLPEMPVLDAEAGR